MNQIAITPYRQLYNYSCAPTVLQVVADLFNRQVTQHEAIKITKCDENGVLLRQVAVAAKKLCKTFFRTLRSIREIEKYIAKGYPVIAGDNYTYICYHAVLIVGYDKNNWSVYDPNTSKIKLVNKNHVFNHSDDFIAVYK